MSEIASSSPPIRGVRPFTRSILQARALADAFQGLPAGVTRWRVAAALRAAARDLGLTSSMLTLLEHYIDLTYDSDWEAGAEPIIGRPVVEIADALGKSERQVRNLERALAELGLLAWRDSGNHHRHARRDRAGRLLYAYGPTLAPLGVRAQEILERASAARQAIAEKRRLRLAIAALRRDLTTILSAAEDGTVTHERRERLRTLSTPLPARASAGELNDQLAALLALAADIHAADSMPEGGEPEIRRRQIQTPKEKFVRVATRPDTTAVTITLAHAAAGPIFTANLRHTPPDWSSLADAGRLTALSAGVSEHDWAKACTTIGRHQATLCAILLEGGLDRPTDSPIAAVSHPAAYFRALAQRAANGRLKPRSSLVALANRRANLQPERALVH